MAVVKFEEFVPMFQIDGDINFWAEENPLKGESLTLKADQKYIVKLNWTQLGPLCYALSGKWICNIYFEKMGPQETTFTPQKKVDFIPVPGNEYKVEMEFFGKALGQGVYRVVAELLLESNSGIPMPVAAFADLGWVHVYHAIDM